MQSSIGWRLQGQANCEAVNEFGGVSASNTYRIVGVIAFFLSLIPDVALLINPEAIPMPGATPLAVLMLILFHSIAAVLTIGVLTTRTVEQ